MIGAFKFIEFWRSERSPLLSLIPVRTGNIRKNDQQGSGLITTNYG